MLLGRLRAPRLRKSILEQAEFGFRIGNAGNREDIKAVGMVLKAISADVGVSGSDNALLLLEADGIFRRIAVFAGFDFDESKGFVIPGDDVDFSGFGPIGGRHYSIAELSQVVSSENFGAAAEGQETVKE
jgi:hypothetical protein